MRRDVSWISEARFAPYLEGSGGDVEAAWDLYEWNARVSSALTECIHHTEVLVRNAMMRELEKVHPLDYPWRDSHDQVEKAAAKLKKKNSGRSVTPDAIIASVTLGFWATFLHDGSQNEELWRKCLRESFPKSSGVRNQVDRAVSDMLELRNRCAHQDSLLSLDPVVELEKILALAGWVDPGAREWISSIEQVRVLCKDRPVASVQNTVIVGSKDSSVYDLYIAQSAYICSTDRTLAPVEYVGFYFSKKICPHFAHVESVRVNPLWNSDEVDRLRKSSDAVDKRLSGVIGYALSKGFSASGSYTVYLLSGNSSPDTRVTSGGGDIPHCGSGRGSAFVKERRYFSLASVLRATDTSQIS
ncbi:hypothetical protein [uncultured Corynebacterium sp.]|uniref:hypothetical protein n=1 Tax=uncultured Corynebacterium sp. TaxID=159447 RepID=UPI0025D02968|nr:hypothetical protein [uncultured Corynebacterium sp.]